MIIFLFGEMGMGKNYVGSMVAKKFGIPFYDGDEALPRFNKYFGFFSKEEVESFVKNNLLVEITKRAKEGCDIVVAQALYFEDHRKMLLDHFGKENILFLHITTTLESQERQLRMRRFGSLWVKYASANRPYFETPKLEHIAVQNEGDAIQLSAQLDKLPIRRKTDGLTSVCYESKSEAPDYSSYKTYAIAAGVIGLGMFAAAKYLGNKSISTDAVIKKLTW